MVEIVPRALLGRRFLLRANNEGHPASLEVRKVDSALPDEQADDRGLVRVIDESGEDYLYPTDRFVAVELPRAAAGAFTETSRPS